MAVKAPWELVSAPTVPDSVELWALHSAPPSPVTIASVNSVKWSDVKTVLRCGPPVEPYTGKLVWREFEAEISADDIGPNEEIGISYLVIVDITLPKWLLVLFKLPNEERLDDTLDKLIVKGILQASKFL